MRIVGRDEGVAICVISDGAGSAKYAQEASALAVDAAMLFFAKQLQDHPHPEELIAEYDRSDGEALLREQRQMLQKAADERGASLNEFSTTLLVAVAHPCTSMFFQVGDGCWSICRSGILGAVTWPTAGEFAGQTDFVTSEDAVRSFQLQRVHGKFEFAVGISDGLERLAVDMVRGIPHAKFFHPLVQKLESLERSVFEENLRAFLESDRLCERTDDDKSLLILAPNERGL